MINLRDAGFGIRDSDVVGSVLGVFVLCSPSDPESDRQAYISYTKPSQVYSDDMSVLSSSGKRDRDRDVVNKIAFPMASPASKRSKPTMSIAGRAFHLIGTEYSYLSSFLSHLRGYFHIYIQVFHMGGMWS